MTITPQKMGRGRWSYPERRGDEGASYGPMEVEATPGTGYVYFLGSPNGKRIKIGFSKKDTWDRLDDHSKGDAFGDGGDYEVLAVVRATRHAESAIHSSFRSHLVAKREVYDAEPLIPYVTWLRDQYFVSVTPEQFTSMSGRKIIDTQMWLPGPGRTSDRRSENSLLIYADPWAFLPSRVVTGDDYYTPPHIVDCVRAALGGVIDLDPCSHVIANQIVRARQFYTRDQNGIAQAWFGRVYINPPFSDWPEWVEKTLEAAASVEALVLLGATRTLTAQYFEPLLRRADAMCVITGRTPFWGMDTESDSPTDGHFLLYIGQDVQRFMRATSELGASWARPQEPLAILSVAEEDKPLDFLR